MRSVFLFLIVLLFGCTERTDPPDGILSEERFTELLVEVHVLEADIAVNANDLGLRLSTMQKDHAELFQREGVSQEQFVASYTYYAARPDDMHRIYDDVLVRLSRLKDEQHEEPTKPDTTAVSIE